MTFSAKAALSSMAFLGATAAVPAFAGGYVEPVSEPAPVVVQPQQLSFGNWAGGYVGAYAATGKDDTSSDLGGPDPNGESAGVVGGYNWQSGRWVYGVEADIGSADYSDEGSINATQDMKVEIDKTASLRGRVGYDMGRWMPYATVGVSAADASYKISDAAGTVSKDDDTMTGYSAGFGAEYMLNDQWSVKGEYLYTKYDGRFEGVDDIDHDVSALRLGVNYHF